MAKERGGSLSYVVDGQFIGDNYYNELFGYSNTPIKQTFTYGVAAGDFVIDLPEVVDGIPLYGQDGTDNFPRNEAESQMLNEIIKGFQAQQNLITDNTSPEAGLETMTIEEENALKMEQFREMQ